MMFLLRSAFWLGLVFSAMPTEKGEVARSLHQAQESAAAGTFAAVKAECLDHAGACVAIARAAGATTIAGVAETIPAPHANPKEKGARPSASSLTSGDLAAPWRGRKARTGA